MDQRLQALSQGLEEQPPASLNPPGQGCHFSHLAWPGLATCIPLEKAALWVALSEGPATISSPTLLQPSHLLHQG